MISRGWVSYWNHQLINYRVIRGTNNDENVHRFAVKGWLNFWIERARKRIRERMGEREKERMREKERERARKSMREKEREREKDAIVCLLKTILWNDK